MRKKQKSDDSQFPVQAITFTGRKCEVELL